MRLSLVMPMITHTEEEAAGLKGQWVTILAFGNSTLAQVAEVERDADGAAVVLILEEGNPEAEAPLEPVFHPGTPADDRVCGPSADGGWMCVPWADKCNHDGGCLLND